MRAFTIILLEILTNKTNIPELTDLRQVKVPENAKKVPNLRQFNNIFALKIARLHTWMLLIGESTRRPEPHIVRDIAEIRAGTDTATYLTSSQLDRDGQAQIQALSCILVQLVREEFPAEGRRYEVMYYIRPTGPHSADFVYAPIEYSTGLD